MKMYINSVVVGDQEKTHAFYTKTLSFAVKHDIPMSEHRWLTLVLTEKPDSVELALEPNQRSASRDFQAALRSDRTAFNVTSIASEVTRLEAAGVTIAHLSSNIGDETIAAFDRTCRNLIELHG